MASGRVCTGFSYPFVALYGVASGALALTSGMELARGVSVQITPNEGSDNNFFANNQVAESDSTFGGGDLTLTVDGLKDDANKLIYGLPTADTDGWTEYNDDQVIPYVAVGYIARFQSDGVVEYEPTVLLRCKFNQAGTSAQTQGESIDYQTQELSAKIYRAEIAKNPWKSKGKGYATESEALAALKAKLNIAK